MTPHSLGILDARKGAAGLGDSMSKRITLRLGEEDYEKLQRRCQDMSLDISFVVRDALGRYFADSGTADRQDQCASTSPVMPAEAFAVTGPYRAWSGDLRVELRRRLLDMLALAHSTAGQYPRTKGVREVYVAILEAYNQLNEGGHGR
jgi:hypothetical protein